MAPPTVDVCMQRCAQLSRTDLQYLQDWLSKQPHLPPMTDEEVVQFLHSNEYSLEKTKVCIDKYGTMRTHAPEVFANRDPVLELNRSQAKFFHITPIPRKDSRGYTVVGMGLQPAADLSKFDPYRSAFLALAIMELVIRDDPTAPGYTFIMDAQNLALGHITKAPLPLLKKLLTYIQEAAPLRMKSVHIIHMGPLVERVMVLIRPFLGHELQKLLHFHAEPMDKFYDELPRDILPEEYGGTCGSACDYYRKQVLRLEENRDWLLSQEKQTVDESKRPGQAKSTGDVFGMEGSFKKLDID